ncbi:MAG: TetR/AcrR family transcriptional regulator, partial [Spongiibacteraceae bacterium]
MSQTPRYHHGDLRATLLEEATALLKEQGIEGLSLRRLAERAGVSRTAPYHHFKDKNALLCALATQAFSQMDQLLGQVQLDGSDTEQLLRNTVRAYLRFATANPELYELMFGRILWKSGQASVELKAIAYASFRNYADKVNSLFNAPGLSADTDPLRLAQASWAT